MDYISQMTALLSELRRERNGEVADTMRFYGKGCGLNLGVAIHTVRAVAAAFPHRHDFAEYLYRQDVRELRIAALWLAEPEKIVPQAFDFWAEGIINSEIAEQAAMALFSKIGCADKLIGRWGSDDNVLLAYAALLTASRNSSCDAERTLDIIENMVDKFDDNRLIGRGAVAAAVFIEQRAKESVMHFAERIAGRNSATARYITDELSWQLDY